MVLRSLYSRISQKVWSTVRLRVGSKGQVRTNKGYKPTAFSHLGEALLFARHSKRLRPATVEQFVKAHVSTKQRQEIKYIPGGFIKSIEEGRCIPSLEVQAQLEKIVGVPLTRPRKVRTTNRKL